MGLDSYMQRVCTDTAVYWGSPQEDGYGGKIYDTPVDISCFWEDTIQVFQNTNGEIVISKAEVFVLQDVDENGILYHGSLSDLSESEKSDPLSVEGAYFIRKFEKLPALGGTSEYIRKVYLTPQ